jgi:hypothetical protein
VSEADDESEKQERKHVHKQRASKDGVGLGERGSEGVGLELLARHIERGGGAEVDLLHRGGGRGGEVGKVVCALHGELVGGILVLQLEGLLAVWG